MLAKVSPASWRAMIDGQSCWGIFPLLLDLSIPRPLCLRIGRSHEMPDLAELGQDVDETPPKDARRY
jgi:hypothetical protein